MHSGAAEKEAPAEFLNRNVDMFMKRIQIQLL